MSIDVTDTSTVVIVVTAADVVVVECIGIEVIIEMPLARQINYLIILFALIVGIIICCTI